jgi:ketosteroid isomerase-like protein
LATVFRVTYLPQKLVRIDLADISRERGLGHLCHDAKQSATNTAQEALSLTSIGNKGPMFFVARRPLTKGAVLSAIGDTDVTAFSQKPRSRSLGDKPVLDPEESMKTRILGALVGLAISFALPTYAQQKDLADPQTIQKLLAIVKADEEAENNHDAAAKAALFTRDAVFLTPAGPIIGRQAIQKWYTEAWQQSGMLFTNYVTKVDGNGFHLIGTAGNELWATGESSQTGQGKNGEPIPVKNHWLCIFVREGDDWKMRACAYNMTPESVILIYKSFGPSPTAKP